MIKEIAAWILNHPGLPWTLDVNFFVGQLPMKNINEDSAPVRVMAVLERVPSPVVGDLPDYADKRIQIWNRNVSYFQAKEDADQVFAILHGATGWVLPVVVSPSDFYAWTIDADATPAPIANPNIKGYYEFSTNYLARISSP